MNPVICVTEFTDLTFEAATVASRLAARWGERVLLVRSVDEREQFAYPLRSRLVREDWRRLEDEAARLRRRDFDFEPVVLRGQPEDGIAGFAWKSRSRLIVVGSAPTAVVEHWALGCLAEEISDTSLVPVLAVRSASPFEAWLAGTRPLNVWVGIDPATRQDAVLYRLDEWRQTGRCRVSALMLAPEAPQQSSPPAGRDREDGEFMRRELAARSVTLAGSASRRDPAGEFVERARAAGADMLLIASHPRDDLTLLPHRTFSHEILRHAPMNVLCVPESDIEPPRFALGSASEAVGEAASAQLRMTASEHPIP